MDNVYYPASLVSEVLSSSALTVVKDKDGRQFSDFDLGRLAILADVALDLGLADLATRLDKLWSVASKGHTKDLERAALVCLIESEN